MTSRISSDSSADRDGYHTPSTKFNTPPKSLHPKYTKDPSGSESHTSQGIKVYTGPSRNACLIRLDDGPCFRFECGEYLRASEVVAAVVVEGHVNGGEGFDPEECDVPIECFAKLYRNKHLKRVGNETMKTTCSTPSDMIPLSNLIVPGEWVHVYCSNSIYLQESKTPPTIQRQHKGWRYDVTIEKEGGVQVRKGPSFDAECTGTVLQHGDNILVNERVTTTSGEDGITWLHLNDGHGWVRNIGEDGVLVMMAHSNKKQGMEPYNNLIARLFNTEVAN